MMCVVLLQILSAAEFGRILETTHSLTTCFHRRCLPCKLHHVLSAEVGRSMVYWRMRMEMEEGGRKEEEGWRGEAPAKIVP